MTSGIRLPLLPFVAAGLQFGAGAVARPSVEHAMVLASHAVVAVWLVVNVISLTGWRRVGTGVALFGWLLNLAVMLPNGGMPVSPSAVDRLAGAGHGIDVSEGHRSKHVLLDEDTVLPALGDIHTLSPIGVAYSAGDVVLALGLLVILAAAWTPSPLTNQRSRPVADTTSATSVVGSIGRRYSSSATP